MYGVLHMIHIRSVGVRIQIRTQLLSSLIDKSIQPNLGFSEMMAQSDSRQPTSFARPEQLDPKSAHESSAQSTCYCFASELAAER